MGFVSVPFAGIRDGPHLCLSVSPAESEPEAEPEAEPESLEPFLGVATREAWPEREELLEQVRLGVLSWDESVLETLSPKLTMGTGSGGWGGGAQRRRRSVTLSEQEGRPPRELWRKGELLLGKKQGRVTSAGWWGSRLPAWTSYPPESLLCLPSHAVMARGKQAPAEFVFYLFI